MIGTTILKNERNWAWIQIPSLLAVVSVALAIWKGPFWIFLCSSLGLFGAGMGFKISFGNPDRYPGKIVYILVFVSHLFLLGIAWTLYSLFLKPMPEGFVNIPKIDRLYSDVSGLFRLHGPLGWTYVKTPSSGEEGVSIRPENQTHYMGASDVQVWVRKLETPPASEEAFIEKLAGQMRVGSRNPKSDALFKFETEKTQLINGKNAVFSILDIKKFWVPIRQVTLFALKNQKYMCSVSVTGLKNHSKYSKILALGLMETLKIETPSKL